jgi:hypothetical protein
MLHPKPETRSYTISRKEELFAQLLTSIDLRYDPDRGETFQSIGAWAERTPIILDGKPFTFERHEYLIEPYQDTHTDVTEMKATQMGLTSKAMLKAMYGARYGAYRGILYLFPSKTDVTEFSKGRVSPLIEDNPETIGKWVKDTDAANIKKVWNTYIYFRGMVSRVGLKSIPVDFVIFDELDEAPISTDQHGLRRGGQHAVDMALERMSHSELREVLKLSNPTMPDYGIDRHFQETDQRYWLLKCPSCSHHTCLEDTFPECLKEIQGRVIRACERCLGELNPSVGEWVAKRPAVTEKRGYHYSQLFSHYVPPAEILHQFRTTNNLQDFYNLKIGVAYVEAENRLSVEEVLALCGNEGIAASAPGPCFMGVDQGKDLHVVIGRRHWQKAGQIVHLGIYRDWEDLDRLMKVFHVSRCVVDALPETRNARAFAEWHKGKVFLNYYQEHQKGKYAWNERDLTVSCNRTESLDASHNEVMQGQIILPRECEITREFAHHLHNVAKKLEEDEETGSKRYIYVRLGSDHFRHALNYEAMARQFGAGSFFRDYDFS